MTKTGGAELSTLEVTDDGASAHISICFLPFYRCILAAESEDREDEDEDEDGMKVHFFNHIY